MNRAPLGHLKLTIRNRQLTQGGSQFGVSVDPPTTITRSHCWGSLLSLALPAQNIYQPFGWQVGSQETLLAELLTKRTVSS